MPVPVPASTLIYPRLVPSNALDPREATVDRLVTRNYGVLPQEAVQGGWNLTGDDFVRDTSGVFRFAARADDMPSAQRLLPTIHEEFERLRAELQTAFQL